VKGVLVWKEWVEKGWVEKGLAGLLALAVLCLQNSYHFVPGMD